MTRPGRSIVFVNGAWMASESWSDFRKPFEATGYLIHTMEWPFLDAPPDELLRNPPKSVGALSTTSIIAYYANFIKDLPEPPLIIGHSFGGLFIQMLLDQGLGWAGMAIDSAPIGGIIPGPTTFMAALPVIMRLGGWRHPYTLTKQGFCSTCANIASGSVQDEAYERFIVSTSGLIFYQNARWIDTFIRLTWRTQTILITAAEKDRTISPDVAKVAHRKQKHSRVKTGFLSFQGISHFLIAEPGREKVATSALEWAEQVANLQSEDCQSGQALDIPYQVASERRQAR